MSDAIQQFKEIIVRIVTERPGIRATEIISHPYLTELISNSDLTTSQFMGVIEDLSKVGDVMEVEYITLQMNYRVKSLYFPKGTQIVVPTGH